MALSAYVKKGFAIRVIRVMVGIAVLVAILIGCATQVPIQVQRPPTWNTLGMQRIAIMPFTTTDGSGLQRHAATLLTTQSQSGIQATNHFTLVNPDAVRQAQARGNAENIVDVIFSGQVTSVSVQNTSRQGQIRNRDGTVTNFIEYIREVQLSFNYGLSSSRGADYIGGPVNRSDSMRSTARDDPQRLTSAEAMVQSLVQNNMRNLHRYVAPYTVTERRRFERETSDNRDTKQRARDADALIKARNFRPARDAFLGIYRDTGSFAAAYNAGILTELLGDTEGAIEFFQRVHHNTGNPRFAVEIARLHKVMEDAGLLEDFRENLHQRDRVIANMVNILPANLPSEPRIALINNSQNHRDLAEMVINGIMEGFLSKNITVVDRSNQALMDMERNYQLSGNVSDDEIVRIGHGAGVNTFILVAIIGTGATRRLSVRMLDVERSTIIYQSPQTNEMNL
jgi:hypothetical protein